MTSAPSLLRLLKTPSTFLFALGFSFLFFDVQYLMMSRLPGYENEMCVMGAGLNPSNISFAILISLMGGLFVIGFIETLKKREVSFSALSFSSIGAFVGSMTVFCAACTIPVLSLFGFAVGLSFFTDYNLGFKIVSLLLMSVGLYYIDRQIKDSCDFCVE